MASFAEIRFHRWALPEIRFCWGMDQISNTRRMVSHHIVLRERLIQLKEGESLNAYNSIKIIPIRTENLAFQIWGSALIEPQILQSKCSEQLCRILGSSQLEPRIRKFGQMVSEVKLNCAFQGLKMAKKWLFQIFHGVQTYKKYILQKKWSKNLIPAPGNGESNLPPLIWGCHRQLDDRHQ